MGLSPSQASIAILNQEHTPEYGQVTRKCSIHGSGELWIPVRYTQSYDYSSVRLLMKIDNCRYWNIFTPGAPYPGNRPALACQQLDQFKDIQRNLLNLCKSGRILYDLT